MHLYQSYVSPQLFNVQAAVNKTDPEKYPRKCRLAAVPVSNEI